jgi:hypothetical protein
MGSSTNERVKLDSCQMDTVKENTVGVHVCVFQHVSMHVLIQYVLPVNAPAVME